MTTPTPQSAIGRAAKAARRAHTYIADVNDPHIVWSTVAHAVLNSIDRKELAQVLRDHQPPLGLGDSLPGDEFDCCTKAIIEHLLGEDE